MSITFPLIVVVSIMIILFLYNIYNRGNSEAKNLFCKLGFHGKTDDIYNESKVRVCTCRKCGMVYPVFDDEDFAD